MVKVQFNFESQPWATKLQWNDASADLTIVCRTSRQVRCHKAVLAAASPFISFLLQELGEQQDAVLVLDEVEAAHLRSLLSLLYYGWADAENTGGLIQLWKQLGITVVRLAPPSIQVVNESSIDVTEDIFMQRRKSEEEGGTLKELEKMAQGVSKEARTEEVNVEELDEFTKDAEVDEVEEDQFEELEKGRVFKVKAAQRSPKGEEKGGLQRNIGGEEGSRRRKRERADNFQSKEEAKLPKEKKRVARNVEEEGKEEVLRVEQVKTLNIIWGNILRFWPNPT